MYRCIEGEVKQEREQEGWWYMGQKRKMENKEKQDRTPNGDKQGDTQLPYNETIKIII